MVIGRCITADGRVSWFSSQDGRVLSSWDPASRLKGPELTPARFLPPVPAGKIVAVGLNYRDHASELGMVLPEEPILFIKPSSAVIGHLDEIRYPGQSARVDYEAELACVIGRQCRNVTREHARDCILGYTCFNDVTARDLQVKDGQWTRAKSFDTFAPVGPWVALDIEDPHRLSIAASLNGRVVQSSNTANLVFDCYDLVAFISSVMTLMPYDIIATGTPAGIGPMARGDEISVTIEGIGTLTNRVV